MRKRLLDNPGALADYEILEMLLFFGIPRRDTKPIAKGLVMRFGGLRGVLLAQPGLLAAAGLPSRAAESLHMVADAAARLTEAERRDPVILTNHQALDRYLVDAASPWRLGLSVLLLGTRNQVLADCGCEGAEGRSIVNHVLREALRWHATAMIILRRTEGALHVTELDHMTIQQIRDGATPFSIAVHDLVVVGPDRRWLSLAVGGQGA